MLNFLRNFLKTILNGVKNTNRLMLRHDNDVEADRKTTY